MGKLQIVNELEHWLYRVQFGQFIIGWCATYTGFRVWYRVMLGEIHKDHLFLELNTLCHYDNQEMDDDN